MVSDIPFNEPSISILSEQKSSSSILGYKNFKTSGRNLATMAQVDSLTKTSVHLSPIPARSIDQTENMNHSSNSNDLADDFYSSDIDLSISDDREASSENEDAIGNRKNKKKLEKNVNTVKDTESLESLDKDIANTAHLVGTGFSADEFDQIDCLDAIDNASNNINSSSIASSSTNEDTLVNNCSKSSENTLVKDVNSKDADSSENQHQVNASPAKVERNNNLAEKTDKNEERNDSPIEVQPSTSSEPLSKSTVENVESETVQQTVPKEIPCDRETNKITLLEKEIKEENLSLEESTCSKTDPSEEHTSPVLSSKSEPLNIVRSRNSNSQLTEKMPSQSGNNSSKTTEKISVRAEDDLSKQAEESSTLSENDATKQTEEMSVDTNSAPDVLPIEKSNKSDQNDSSTVETIAKVQFEKDTSKRAEAMSVDADPSSEPMSIESDISGIDKLTENRSKNHNLKQSEEMSVDNDSASKAPPTDNADRSNENQPSVAEKITETGNSKQIEEMLVDSDSSSKTIPNGNIDELGENRSTPVVEKITENHTSAPASNQSPVEDIQITERSETDVASQNDDLSRNHVLEEQADDPSDQIHSPMVMDDDKDPKSVESTDIIIDSVESEIVELDADDDSVILGEEDRTGKLTDSVSQISQQKFNQLFENTAKEITHDDIGAEVVVGGDDYDDDDDPKFRGIEISLNRFMPNENDSRKRRFQHNQTETSLKHTLLNEKRARISETETSDSCSDTRAGTYSTDRKTKPPVNRARKHTSSTNVGKTYKEIEKKLRDDLNKRREPSPRQDLFDEYDFEIHDNDGDIITDTRCDEAAQNTDDNSYKIQLNYDVVSKDNLKNIFKIMRTKLSRRQLEEIVIQKCCEMISDSNEIGTLRRQVADLQQAEMFRKQKILNLEKQISQLKAVCQRYLDQVQENPNKSVTPIKITRSVGLQVARGDTSPFVNFEPNPIVQRGQEKLKKLLSAPAPASKKSATVPETHQNVSRQHTASPLPSSINYRNTDPRLMNGNARISSPLSSSSSPTSTSSSSTAASSRSNKKIIKSTDAIAPVIDLTDKDDKNENETTVATKNLLATVNGTVVTYVPVKVNQDQNRQIIKPGTSILVNGQLMTVQSTSKYPAVNVHPAPVPPPPPTVMVPGAKPIPPRPILKIDKNKSGIMLSWEFPSNTVCAEIAKYQLFAYQETNLPPRADLWKAVGDVSALPLPMACTLTQFVEGFKYHFTVRAVDVHNRYGPFSAPRTITL